MDANCSQELTIEIGGRVAATANCGGNKLLEFQPRDSRGQPYLGFPCPGAEKTTEVNASIVDRNSKISWLWFVEKLNRRCGKIKMKLSLSIMQMLTHSARRNNGFAIAESISKTDYFRTGFFRNLVDF